MLVRLAWPVSRIGARLTPRPLVRLDRWLVTHRPLLWRSRVHRCVWYSVLGCLAAATAGALVPGAPAAVWTADQVNVAYSAIQFVCLGAIAVWVLTQLAVPVGERSLPDHLRLGVLNALAALLLLLPGHAFVLSATRVIAGAAPEAFLEDLVFHREHGFWCCHPPLDEDLVRRHRSRLEDSLGRYGLTTDGSLLTYRHIWLDTRDHPYARAPCTMDSLCLAVRDGAGVLNSLLLRERLTSIEDGRRLWLGNGGGYHERYVSHLLAYGYLVVTVVLLIAVTSRPAYAWRRQFLRTGHRRRRVTLRLSLPRWLRRMDHELLLRRPLLWATRLHMWLFQSATLGLALVVLVSILDDGEPSYSPLRDFGYNIVLYSIGVAWPVAWALSRYIQLPAITAAERRAMVRRFLLAVLPVPSLIYWLGVGAGWHLLNWVDLLFFGPSFALSIVLVRNYLDEVATALALAGVVGGVGVLFLAPLMLPNFWALRTVILPTLVASWALLAFLVVPLGATRPVTRRRALAAASVVLSAPVAIFCGWWLLLTLDEMPGFSRDVSMILATLYPLIIYPLYVHWFSPLLRLLVLARYEPRAA